jgi:hypothetical protein
MKLADSAESGDCQTNREIVKYLFVLSHTVKRLPAPQFRRYESQVRGHTDEPGSRPQIRHRTNRRCADAVHGTNGRCVAARHLSPLPGEMPFLRGCLADNTVARS